MEDLRNALRTVHQAGDATARQQAGSRLSALFAGSFPLTALSPLITPLASQECHRLKCFVIFIIWWSLIVDLVRVS